MCQYLCPHPTPVVVKDDDDSRQVLYCHDCGQYVFPDELTLPDDN